MTATGNGTEEAPDAELSPSALAHGTRHEALGTEPRHENRGRVLISLDRGDVGVRLDRALARHLQRVAGASRTRVQAWIESGAVRINDRPEHRVSRRLAAGDQLEVHVSASPTRARRQVDAPPLHILYEDDDLLAVNKPPGQVVHPTRTHASGTLLQALLSHFGRSPGDPPAPRLVSRLDRQTSGVVLVAKRASVHAALQRATRGGAMHKTYLAFCVGRVSPRRGEIALRLSRDPGDPRRMAVTDRGGSASITRYRRLALIPAQSGGNAGAYLSLVACQLITGRTHQIRVHLAASGWPVLHDVTYGPRRTPAFDDGAIDAALGALTHQALHASSVHVAHPVTGVAMALVAPPPLDLQNLLDACALSVDVSGGSKDPPHCRNACPRVGTGGLTAPRSSLPHSNRGGSADRPTNS